MENFSTLKELLRTGESRFRNNTAFYLKDKGNAVYGISYEKFKGTATASVLRFCMSLI
jgi:hypothetical protein